MPDSDERGCTFCGIAAGSTPASIVAKDAMTIAFIDLRQFHPGHTLVIPRRDFADVRELDHSTGAALMTTVVRLTRAVSAVFPNEGISLWHSIGEAAFQEVPHLHIHIHPRFRSDGVLRVYPRAPETSPEERRNEYAAMLRQYLASDDAAETA